MVSEAHKRATVELRLHGGRAPAWLISRMIRLAKPIMGIIVEEYGSKELLRRLSDPLWFQSLSYVLGYDWDSSGVTTVTIGVLKSVLSEDMGLLIAGGKGSKARGALEEIEKIGESFGFSEKKINELKTISRVIAKVDNALVQDGYEIYHHAVLVEKDGLWAIIQQGMNTSMKLARRYHWYSGKVKSFVVEPHCGITGDMKHPFVINITAKKSIETQRTSLDLVKEGPSYLKRDLAKLNSILRGNRSLDSFFNKAVIREKTNLRIVANKSIYLKLIPKKVNWGALEEAHNLQLTKFEELIKVEGIGPSTLRALALISELIYNASLSWEDPIKYTFAVGGKDGVPYPVNIKVMEEASEILEKALEELKFGKKEKSFLLKRLSEIQKRFRH